MAGFDAEGRVHPPAHVLTDDSGKAAGGCAAVLLLAAAIVIIIAVQSNSTIATTIAIAVVALGLAVLMASALETRRWNPLELHFPIWPLPLGSTSSVEIVRTAKRPPPDAQVQVEAQVSCEERATYTVGTDTRTDTETVYDETSTTSGQLQGGVFRTVLELHIPADHGAPSFDLGNNEVRWELELHVDQLSRIMTKMTFELEVAAVLDTGLRNIQDATPEIPT